MTTITFRRTRQGEWVAFGPAAAIKPNRIIDITKRDGSTVQRTVEKVGKTFTADGTECCYGYLAPEPRPYHARQPRRHRPGCCAGCGDTIDPQLNGDQYGAPGYCFDCA